MASLKAQAHQALNMQRRKVSRQLKPREMRIHHGKTNYLLAMGVASHMQEKTSEGPGIPSQMTLIQKPAWHVIKGLLS